MCIVLKSLDVFTQQFDTWFLKMKLQVGLYSSVEWQGRYEHTQATPILNSSVPVRT